MSTAAATAKDFAATQWPWRVKITYTDGRVREDDYADDFDPAAYARHVSGRPEVARVEVTVAFVDGQPTAASKESNR